MVTSSEARRHDGELVTRSATAAGTLEASIMSIGHLPMGALLDNDSLNLNWQLDWQHSLD